MPTSFFKSTFRGEPLAPEDIGSIIFDLNPNAGTIFSDASELVAANDGDTVYRFRESEYGFLLSQASAGERPTVGETADGVKYLYSSDGARWIGTGDLTGLDLTTLRGYDRDPVTVVVFSKYATTPFTTTRYFFGLFESNSSNGLHVCAFAAGTPDLWFFRRYDNATGRSASSSVVETPYTTDVVMHAHRYHGTGIMYGYANGSYKAKTTAKVAQSACANIRIFTTGSSVPTNFVEADARFYRALIFNKALTAVEMHRLYNWARGIYV